MLGIVNGEYIVVDYSKPELVVSDYEKLPSACQFAQRMTARYQCEMGIYHSEVSDMGARWKLVAIYHKGSSVRVRKAHA